jgi:hypothetical protein
MGIDKAALILDEAASEENCRSCGCLWAVLLEAEELGGNKRAEALSEMATILLKDLLPVEIDCRECKPCPPAEATLLLSKKPFSVGCGEGCC